MKYFCFITESRRIMNYNFSITYYAALFFALFVHTIPAHEPHPSISEIRNKINSRFIQRPPKSMLHLAHNYFWDESHEKTLPEEFNDFLVDKETVRILKKITDIAKDGTT